MDEIITLFEFATAAPGEANTWLSICDLTGKRVLIGTRFDGTKSS